MPANFGQELNVLMNSHLNSENVTDDSLR